MAVTTVSSLRAALALTAATWAEADHHFAGHVLCLPEMSYTQ
jgi:hypothetical protein